MYMVTISGSSKTGKDELFDRAKEYQARWKSFNVWACRLPLGNASFSRIVSWPPAEPSSLHPLPDQRCRALTADDGALDRRRQPRVRPVAGEEQAADGRLRARSQRLRGGGTGER